MMVMHFLTSRSQVHDLSHPPSLYSTLMELLLQFANCGLIHCDFNEFNILINDRDVPTVIDFPQMISISHPNAEMCVSSLSVWYVQLVELVFLTGEGTSNVMCSVFVTFSRRGLHTRVNCSQRSKT